jgi:hypothetical protein
VGIWGNWRRLLGAISVAIACVIVSMAATKPAAAYPVEAIQPGNLCPGGYALIGAGSPLGVGGALYGAPYCGGNFNTQANGCPVGWLPTNLQAIAPNTGTIQVCTTDFSDAATGNNLRFAVAVGKVRLQSIVTQILLYGPNSEKYITELVQEGSDLEDQIHESSVNNRFPGGNTTAGGSSGLHLGMSVSSGPANPFDAFGEGGASVTRGSNLGVTDSAGLAAPGTTFNFKDTSGNGSITASYGVSGLPTDQQLSFRGLFGYQKDNLGIDVGSAQTNTYNFAGAVHYYIGQTYLIGAGGYNLGNGSEALNLDGSTGSFNTRGYWTDLKLGHVFVLFNSIAKSAASTKLPTKAPPKPTGGYAVGLNVSGHIGYSNGQVQSFTDSTGFMFGGANTRYEDAGVRAKLFVLVPKDDFVWKPYVAATLDREFGYSSSAIIPDQPLFPGGDIVNIQQALTFGGAEAGLDVRGPNGWMVGAKGFYQASTNVNVTGGTAYVKIPLNYTPPPVFATRY